MSDLESEIRSLNLRPPGDGLDARVLAEIQAATGVPSRPEDVQKPSTSDEVTRSYQSSRKGVVVTSGWIVAAASMLTGIMIGRMLPQSVPGDEGSLLAASPLDGAANRVAPGESVELNGSASTVGPLATTNSVANGPSIGSQIVESIWLSPAAAAVVWEQQTGQIFNVAKHVGDRRFDMCRDCHRIGG